MLELASDSIRDSQENDMEIDRAVISDVISLPPHACMGHMPIPHSNTKRREASWQRKGRALSEHRGNCRSDTQQGAYVVGWGIYLAFFLETEFGSWGTS